MKVNMNYKKLVSWVSVFSAVLLTAQTAIAATKTAQSGAVKAELSYEKENTGFNQFKNIHIKIAREGKTLVDQPLPESEGNWPVAALETDWGKENASKAFQVRDFDANQEPEVLVDLFTGGAHCCSYSLIYRYNPTTQKYSYTRQDWGNSSYQLQDLNKDGIPEFQSRDDAFAYAFGSYAGSGYPSQIWQYRQGKMVNVTRQYPKLIYNDAYYWWKAFVERRSDQVEYGKGPLSAYVANKYLLGQGHDGWKRAQQAYRGPDRQQFFTELQKFLQQTGYIRRGDR